MAGILDKGARLHVKQELPFKAGELTLERNSLSVGRLATFVRLILQSCKTSANQEIAGMVAVSSAQVVAPLLLFVAQ
jgi:hypothetical protein